MAVSMRTILTLSLLLGLTLAGCASTSDDSKYTTPPTDAQGRYVIDLTGDNKVMPAMAKVPAGATVVWKVGKGGIHDVTSQTGPESFTSDSQYPSKMREGNEYTKTFTKTGTYAYHCALHGELMKAQLRVT